VTGASSGIGRAIAETYAAEGAVVLLTHRASPDRAQSVADAIASGGGRALVRQVDLATRAACERLVADAHAALGRIDVWVNNAGADILTGSGAALSDVDKLDLLLAVDLRGTVLASWRAAKLLADRAGGGVIINMSWDHVLIGMPGLNPQLFAAVKGGVLAFSKSLARSVAPRVRVNVIAPGWIDTSFGQQLEENHQSMRRRIVESTPLKRWGTPDDVAGAAVFLASPAAAFLTGTTIVVGGGVVM